MRPSRAAPNSSNPPKASGAMYVLRAFGPAVIVVAICWVTFPRNRNGGEEGDASAVLLMLEAGMVVIVFVVSFGLASWRAVREAREKRPLNG